MQILKIKLSKDEQDAIFNELIKRFNTEDKRQRIYYHIGEVIEYESTLELYTEHSDPDENQQNHISHRLIVKFRITFFHDGDEVEVQDWDIEERIKKYYEI